MYTYSMHTMNSKHQVVFYSFTKQLNTELNGNESWIKQ